MSVLTASTRVCISHEATAPVWCGATRRLTSSTRWSGESAAAPGERDDAPAREAGDESRCQRYERAGRGAADEDCEHRGPISSETACELVFGRFGTEL